MNTENIEEKLQPVIKELSKAYFPPGDYSSKQESFLESASRIEEISLNVPDEYQPPLQYHRARLMALAGDPIHAREILTGLLQGDMPLPEATWLIIQLVSAESGDENTRLRWDLENELGNMLPMSAWGKVRDAKLIQQEADRINQALFDSSTWPTIPLPEETKLLNIAALFDQMGMNAEAAGTYREIIYSILPPPGFPEFGAETWLSHETAKFWLAIAHNEAAIGMKKWALQATLMAVAASPENDKAAAEIVNNLFKAQGKKPKPAPDPEKLIRIAELYRDCNLHPRAIQVLDIASKIQGTDVAGLKRSTLANWRHLVSTYAEGREKICFLFGQKVSDIPADTLAPKPFPYDIQPAP